MDVGKKCLVMAILGVVLITASSPFVITMVFTGKPFVVLAAKESLKPFPPQKYGPIPRTITGMEKIMDNIHLNPAKGEHYRVSLKAVTNGTINLMVFRMDGAYVIQHSLNAGNHTIDLQIKDEGVYALNATSVGDSTVNATFTIEESWSVKITEWEERVDLLKTAATSIGFAVGIIMLVYSPIKLRREIGTPHSDRTGEKRIVGYEVEEE